MLREYGIHPAAAASATVGALLVAKVAGAAERSDHLVSPEDAVRMAMARR